MAENRIHVAAGPEAVWAVLSEPALFGEWVVGTKAVPRADETWPQPGSRLEYELGVGPIGVGDETIVVEAEEPRLLVLRAVLKRLGAATIRIELTPEGDGTLVVMKEEPVEGAIDLLHNPISDALLGKRNDVGLDRLRRLVEAAD